MKKRSYNYRRIKIHRSYTVEDIAFLFDIHKNTVRAWIKDGLQTTDNMRPILIQGRDLAAFLQVRRVKNKKKCNPGEIYCVRCHTPNVPAGDMADYQPINEKIGNLIAICSCCFSIMNRRVSLVNIEHVLGKMIVTIPPALQHIGDRAQPTINSDLEKAPLMMTLTEYLRNGCNTYEMINFGAMMTLYSLQHGLPLVKQENLK